MPHLCVIPARLGSTRLPSKPLRLLRGEPLIAVVAKRIREMAVADWLVVAADDQRIVDAVAPLGIEGILTDRDHSCGTERVAQVAALPRFADAAIVINVQCDEPFISREAVLGAVSRVEAGDEIGTAAVPLPRGLDLDPGSVKVVVNQAGYAQSFGRQVPTAIDRDALAFHHVGVYAYRRPTLLRWAKLPPTDGEVTERLEQLRPMAHGYAIGVSVAQSEAFSGIDTEDDLLMAQSRMGGLLERVS